MLALLFAPLLLPPASDFDLGGPQAIVPMDDSRGHIAVEVYLGERGPFRFQLDTYASVQACIDDDLARELGLEVVSRGRNSDGRTTRSVDFVAIDELRVGPASFRGVRALVDDYDFVTTAHGGSLQGLLGFELFEELLLTIDYPRDRVELRRGELEAGAPGTVPFRMSGGAPDIQLEIGGRRLSFGLDTGMDGTLRLNESDLEHLNVHGDAPVIGMSRTVYSEYPVRGAFLADEVHFAGQRFGASYAHFVPEAQNALRLVGHGFFRDGALTFDQANRRLRFARSPRVPGPPLADSDLEAWTGTFAAGKRGLTIEREGDALFVVLRGGPRLAAVALSETELRCPTSPMALRLRTDANGPAGVYVSAFPDLSGDWFARRVSR